MTKAKPPTPAEYDRWGRTCVKFYEDSPKGAATEPKPPATFKATTQAPQNAKNPILTALRIDHTQTSN